jgi:hypothetical protein
MNVVVEDQIYQKWPQFHVKLWRRKPLPQRDLINPDFTPENAVYTSVNLAHEV